MANDIQHSLEEIQKLLKGLEVLHPELFYSKTPPQTEFEGTDEATFKAYILDLVNRYRSSRGYPKTDSLAEAKDTLLVIEELLRRPKGTLAPEEIVGTEAVEEMERRERVKAQQIVKSRAETKGGVTRMKETALREKKEKVRKEASLNRKKVYLNTEEETPNITLSDEEQQLLRSLVEKARQDPKTLAEQIANEVFEKAQVKVAGTVPTDVLKNEADRTTEDLVDKLLTINPEDISSEMKIVNPDEILIAITKKASLTKIELSPTKSVLVDAAQDILNLRQHDLEVAENYLTGTAYSPLLKFFYSKDVRPRNFEVTEEKTPASKYEFSQDKLQEYYDLRWNVYKTIKELSPEASLTSKQLDTLTGNLYHLTGRQYHIAGSYLAHLQTLGTLPGQAFEIQQRQMVSYTYLSPIIEKLNLGMPFELAISLESGKPVLGFGLRVGPFGKNIFNIGSSVSKGAVSTGGKVATETAIKTATATTAKTGLKALISSIGEIGGPLGHAIAYALTEVVSRVVSKISRWIKEHREIVYYAIGLPVMLVGILFATPALTMTGAGISLFGAAGGAKGAASAISKALLALSYITVSSIAIPLIACLVGIPVVVAFIIFIINSGAYVVPPGSTATAVNQIISSPYVRITKTPSPAGPFENSDLPLTVTYTIKIVALKDPLTNIQINYDCGVVKDGASPLCPSLPANFFASLNIPATLSPGQSFEFSYSAIYKAPEFNDTAVTDVVSVTADASGETAQAAGSASIVIGEPPQECPSIWPVNSGTVTQGAFCSQYSHSSMEAIDIGVTEVPVYATHRGTVTTAAFLDCYGNTIDIMGTCNGKQFVSRYSHLKTISVNIGDNVNMGQQIGISDNTYTGDCSTGFHLHYDFRNYPSLTTTKYPGNAPYMMRPYIPVDIPRGCCTTSSCGTSIP